MKKIDLTEEDMQALMQCVNNGEEPAPELAKKLFPSQFTHDFKTLHDARIPTIEYAGKRPEAAILSEASVMGAACPLQLERCFDGGKINKKATQLMLIKESSAEYETGWRNLIVQGDNLQFLKTCYLNQDPIIRDKVKGKVKLVYIDPPFATRSDFTAKTGEDGYADKIDRAEFVEQLRERLIFLREVLAADGSIYVHLDQRMSGYMRVVLDEVFGRDRFINEIIWRRAFGHSDSTRYGTIHDSLLFYSRGSERTWNALLQAPDPKYIETFFDQYDEERGERYQRISLSALGLSGGGYEYEYRGVNTLWRCPIEKLREHDEQGRLHWPKKKGGVPRLKRYESDYEGVPLQDMWTDIGKIHNTSGELVGYPTQKPEALLERIVMASSNPGDLIMDVFAGSGTVAATAEKLGRRWIVCDFGKHAAYTMQKRLCLISGSQKLGLSNEQKARKGKKPAYGEPPKPFAIVSVGAFDFAKIMHLRENRDAYVSFVLGIFGLNERNDELATKYNVTNVCALRDGNPVEIYPVWDDTYLKEVRVDMDYLQGIVDQAGTKLKGDYFIIAPETCVRVGETTIAIGKNRSVTFKPLTFPYKVLEEVARNFTIEEQPSSSDNINKLISSVGFYFNEEVSLKAKKSKKGFTITEFKTSILDKQECRYTGLDGLAMILIDTDYDEEQGFTVDTVVYHKDIKDGEVPAKGANGKTRIIAIDRYGNESPIAKLS